MQAINAALARLRPYVPLFLRLVLGLTMFWHGFKKFDYGLTATGGTKDFFHFLNIPLPGFFAVVVALLELVGGLCILVGLATRIISALFIIELLVAVIIYKYNKDVGFIGAKEAGAEIDWALIAGFFALAGTGASRPSADAVLRLDRVDTAP
jgi:putative oxidoreductase